MKKFYFILILVVVSFVMVFAGDTIKVLRIHHNGSYTDFPLSKIDCITHSNYDENGWPQSNIVSSVVWTKDNQYTFPISDIESAEVVEKELEGEELYEEVKNDLHDFLTTHEGVTIEEIQAQLEKYPTVTTQVKNDILYLQIDDQDTFICDPYYKTCIKETDDVIEEIDIATLQEEINNALYPKSDNARSVFSLTPCSSSNLTRSSSNNRNVLSKGEILMWDPWKLIKKTPSLNGLKVNTLKDKEATLSKIESFNKYDVVFMCCHGTPEGDIIVPAFEKCNIFMGCGKEVYEGRTIKKEELERHLPSNLSKTILWTSICWGYNSYLKELALNRNVVAFAGCDERSVNIVPEHPFKKFLLEFYSGATVLNAAASSFPTEIYPTDDSNEFNYHNTINDNRVSMKYHDFTYEIIKKVNNVVISEKGVVSGNFIIYCKNKEVTGKVLNVAMSPINNRPCASLTVPYEWYNTTSASRSNINRRAAYDSGVSYGFWCKNKETGKVTEIEFDESTESIYHRYDYDNMISRLVLLGNTKDLEPGTYDYRTYLEIDGEKSYSEKMFEFIKQNSLCPDDNHPHMIDLGLPSGTQWSCCNEEASTPEQYGGYYVFGKVSSAPSLDQIKELIDNTESLKIYYNNVLGWKFTGNNGGTIFLPAAGYYDLWWDEYYFVGIYGTYWSSTPHEEFDYFAYGFNLYSAPSWSSEYRIYYRTVRPVR